MKVEIPENTIGVITVDSRNDAAAREGKEMLDLVINNGKFASVAYVEGVAPPELLLDNRGEGEIQMLVGVKAVEDFFRTTS